jgi:crotonobetainyl-CoA:carnitine CoA-transferase CaiB-like acyl-CoA transferase
VYKDGVSTQRKIATRASKRARPRIAAALEGVRVLEISDKKGAYCGKLLADLGADVIKVEPPEGDPGRHELGAFFAYANTNKRSIIIDFDSRAGRGAFLRLAATADILVETGAPGEWEGRELGYETLRQRRPGLVWTSITGFGRTGPQSRFAAAEIVTEALGGSMYVTGEPDDPPVIVAGSQAWIAASACAASASLIALHEARRSGCGQYVDVSALEVMAAVTHICGAAKYMEDGIVPKRFGSALFSSVPSGAYRCADGRLVYLMVNRPAHWKALAGWVNELTGNVEVLDPMFDGPSSTRQPYRALLDLFLGELFLRLTAEEAYREGQRRHLAITPVNGALDVVADTHLRARRFFVTVEQADRRRLRMPGAPYRLSKTPWRIARPMPRAGGQTKPLLAKLPPLPRRTRRGAGAAETADAKRGPALADLRVLELTAGMAGPWIGRFMAYCGADVIKLESRSHPDVTRLYVSPREPGTGLQEAASPWFTDWNAGKRFVALDLGDRRAVELCKRLVAVCDVVVANYSAGVLEKLGLGYKTLRKVKPDLVMISSTGYGETGPSRGYVTWGPNIEALSAFSSLSGHPHRECTVTQYAYPDALGALHGLTAVMAALVYRARSGEGQRIDLAQYETTVASMGDLFVDAMRTKSEPVRRGNASVEMAPHGCYPCRGDDRWCTIAARDDAAWRRLCAVIERPDLATDERFGTLAGRLAGCAEIDRAIEAWTRERDAYDVMNVLQAVNVAAGVVQTIDDQLHRDAQLAARGFFERITRRNGGEVLANGIPLRFSATPGSTRGTGSPIGADNVAVLHDLLGIDVREIEELTNAGVVQAPREG